MFRYTIFVGCNKKQLPYLKRLKELNYSIILIDKNKNDDRLVKIKFNKI